LGLVVVEEFAGDLFDSATLTQDARDALIAQGVVFDDSILDVPETGTGTGGGVAPLSALAGNSVNVILVLVADQNTPRAAVAPFVTEVLQSLRAISIIAAQLEGDPENQDRKEQFDLAAGAAVAGLARAVVIQKQLVERLRTQLAMAQPGSSQEEELQATVAAAIQVAESLVQTQLALDNAINGVADATREPETGLNRVTLGPDVLSTPVIQSTHVDESRHEADVLEFSVSPGPKGFQDHTENDKPTSRVQTTEFGVAPAMLHSTAAGLSLTNRNLGGETTVSPTLMQSLNVGKGTNARNNKLKAGHGPKTFKQKPTPQTQESAQKLVKVSKIQAHVADALIASSKTEQRSRMVRQVFIVSATVVVLGIAVALVMLRRRTSHAQGSEYTPLMQTARTRAGIAEI
jgi:hypothetical protein